MVPSLEEGLKRKKSFSNLYYKIWELHGTFRKKNLCWLIRQINSRTYLGLFNWKPESYRMCHGKQINETLERMHSCRKNLSKYSGAIFI